MVMALFLDGIAVEETMLVSLGIVAAEMVLAIHGIVAEGMVLVRSDIVAGVTALAMDALTCWVSDVWSHPEQLAEECLAMAVVRGWPL